MAPGRGVDYDRAANEYATHRQIHPGVCRELCARGQIDPDPAVLEVGCGTGNYVAALSRRQRRPCRLPGLGARSLGPAGARAGAGRIAIRLRLGQEAGRRNLTDGIEQGIMKGPRIRASSAPQRDAICRDRS